MLLVELIKFTIIYSSINILYTSVFVDNLILVLGLLGSFIGLIGFYINDCRLIKATHYSLALLLPSGIFMFYEYHNRVYILVLLLITLVTRLWFGRCLFHDHSTELVIPDIGGNAYNSIFAGLILYTIHTLY